MTFSTRIHSGVHDLLMTSQRHHTLTLGLNGKLYLAPLEKDKIHVRPPQLDNADAI